MDVTDRSGTTAKLTEAKWGRFTKALNEFDGWVSRLRADFGAAAADFVVTHRLVETEIEQSRDLKKVLGGLHTHGYDLSLVESSDEMFRVKVVERETSAARHVTVPVELLAAPAYANLRRTYARLVDIVGAPPFTIALGKKREIAETFEQLRQTALDLAKDGIHVSRFKGLGEMNAPELRDTTMDPAKRMLIRVEVEDAAAADAVFSLLMGDQVEPRRLFIEQNAKDVRFLDV